MIAYRSSITPRVGHGSCYYFVQGELSIRLSIISDAGCFELSKDCSHSAIEILYKPDKFVFKTFSKVASLYEWFNKLEHTYKIGQKIFSALCDWRVTTVNRTLQDSVFN